LRTIENKVKDTLKAGGENIDPYTKAHLAEAGEQIERALNATYIYNTDKLRPRSFGLFRQFGQQKDPVPNN